MSARQRGTQKPLNGNANGHANGGVKGTEQIVDARTDHTRWRLKDDDGRQTWHYLESDEELKAWPQSAADKYFLGMDTVRYVSHQPYLGGLAEPYHVGCESA